jgi:hypothetical protein
MMKSQTFSRMCVLFAAVCAPLLATQLAAARSPREHLSLDASWKFHLGDDWPDAINLTGAGRCSGPASDEIVDTYWRSVDLPHDWAIELPFDPAADRDHGFKTLGAKYPASSIAWYRRTFEMPKEDKGKRIWLTFDGMYRDATLCVNNYVVRRHESGYYPFREDITDLVKFGGANTIAVRVDATKFEGWFYEGAGIYRHVWLDKTAPVAIAPDGIFVQAEFEKNIPKGSPKVAVEVSLLNGLTPAFRECAPRAYMHGEKGFWLMNAEKVLWLPNNLGNLTPIGISFRGKPHRVRIPAHVSVCSRSTCEKETHSSIAQSKVNQPTAIPTRDVSNF